MKGLPRERVELRVVGLTFRSGYPDNVYDLANLLAAGQSPDTRLVPEPDNPHDPKAVRVVVEDEHIGYLGRADARRASWDIRRGRALKVTLSRVDVHPEHPEHPSVWVEVA